MTVVHAAAYQTVTRCPHDGCDWNFVGADAKGLAALPGHLQRMHGGVDQRVNGHGGDASAVSGRGEQRGALGEAAAVGDAAVSGSAHLSSEPERAAASSSALGEADGPATPPPPSARDEFEERRRRRKPYTRDEILESFRRFHSEHGRWPIVSDVRSCPYLPSARAVRSVAGLGSWQAVWDALGAGKVPTGMAARKYLGLPVITPSPHSKGGRKRGADKHAAVSGSATADGGEETSAEAVSIEDLTDRAKIAGWRNLLVAEAKKLELHADAYRLIEKGLGLLAGP